MDEIQCKWKRSSSTIWPNNLQNYTIGQTNAWLLSGGGC